MAKTHPRRTEVGRDQLVKLLCDSQAALSIIRNPVHHDRTKHVELDRHFITGKVTKQEFEMDYVPSKLQIADILTKPLPRDSLKNFNPSLAFITFTTKLEGGVEL